METLIQDLRYAVRTLRKSPTFLAVAALTLALGIGANVAIFTLVNTVLLQPLPFPQPDRLVRVFDDLNGASAKDVGISVPELLDLSDRAGVFAQLCAMAPASTALSGGDRVERIEMLGTSPNYFEVLGAKAALGRVYGQADWVPGFVDGVVISDALWKRQFGGDPHVIGRRIRVDEDGYTIIGVMPPEFRHPGPTLARDVELWASAGLIAPPFPTPPVRNLRILRGAMGRLKPGITLAQAQQQLNAFVAQLATGVSSGLSQAAEMVGKNRARSVQPNWKCAHHARNPSCRGHVSSADCLRKHCQPSDRAVFGAYAGIRDSSGAGRVAHAARASTLDGKFAHFTDRRSGSSVGSQVVAQVASRAHAGGRAPAYGGARRLADGRCSAGCFDFYRSAVRIDPRAACLRNRSKSRLKGWRPVQRRIKRAPKPLSCRACRHGGCALGGPPDQRWIIDTQLFRRDSTAARL